jgi:hypothetical protein
MRRSAIESFRANHGVLGGHFEGKATLLLGAGPVQADHRVLRAGRDDDWDRIYGIWRAYWPDAAAYEKNTDHRFQVAVITVR